MGLTMFQPGTDQGKNGKFPFGLIVIKCHILCLPHAIYLFIYFLFFFSPLNYAVEGPTFGEIAGVSTSGVQWISLTLVKPPW